MARVLSLPLTVTSAGSMATITQDHPAEVAQSVAILLATTTGDRRTLPEYGLPDPVFAGVDPKVVAEVVAEWEPRADLEAIEVVTRELEQTAAVHVATTIPTTGPIDSGQEA